MDDLRIDPQEAAKKLESGEAFLLDVVTAAAWRSLPRVPKGALRIPPEEIMERLADLPTGRAVIAFCT